MNRNHGPLSPASSASNDSYIPNYGNAPGPRQGGPGGGFMGAPSDIPYAGGPYGAARPMQTSPPSSNHPSSSTDASRPSGSSVGRPPSSSSSIGGRSMHPGANGHRDSTRSVFRPEHEDVLQKHYYSLQTYLAAHLRDEKGNMKPNRARDKLLRLSVTQFMELSTDVYDELIRREDDRTQRVPNVPRFLPPKQNFHPKRNQARQKLSTLPVERFRQLATDVFFELERRVPRFAASDIDRPMSGGRAPSRGGMRPPPGWRGPPGPRSRNPSEASLGRPLPKAFGGGTVVPNKSTMVEDDDDIDDGSYSDLERDKETIRSQESEIEKLKEQAEEQTTLREDLEQKVQEAQILNDQMREELDMLKRNKLMDEQNLKDQHERELDSMRVASGGSEEQQNKIQRLEEELAKQERLTIEVREESMANLQEMRELSRQNDRAVEQEEKLAAQVVSLEKDVEDWRERYAKLKSQNKSLRASTLGLEVDNGLKDLVSNNGLVKDVDITRFQLAVDELLKTARQTNTEAMIESVKQVTLSVRSIADIGTDGYPTPSSSPHEGTASVAKLKARVTGTANSLITATKQHASASGLSPVALLDAAASNLTAAVVELIKAVGIRASHGDSGAEDAYFGDEYATSAQDEHGSKTANGGWFNWARGTSEDMEPHANGHHEDDYDHYD